MKSQLFIGPDVPALFSLPSPQGNVLMAQLRSPPGRFLSPYPMANSDLGAKDRDADKNTCHFSSSSFGPNIVHTAIILAVMLMQQLTRSDYGYGNTS